MAGDEAHARITLNEMQMRILQGPHHTLGVAEGATPEQVRAAFLELTKQFHPARFGRMAPEVLRLANEVFLGIKGAHEAMLRALGAPTRAGSSSSRPGDATLKPTTNRIPTVPRGAAERPQSPSVTPLARPTTPTGQAPSSAPTVSRAITPTRPQSPTGAGVRISTARPGTPPTRSASPPSTPPLPVADAGTLLGQKTAPVFDEQQDALQRVLDLMTAKNWVGARTALNALAARVPASKQYRALLCVTRGREAQLGGRGEEAVLEYQRALQLDPDSQQAKAAMAELMRRR